MAKARFQALVDLHSGREADARRALGRSEAARAAVVERIEAARAARAEAALAADPRLRAVYGAYCQRIDIQLAAFAAELKARDADVERARQALVDAHRDVAVFTRLRDRSLAERAVVRERRAARALDDFAAARMQAADRPEELP